MLDETDLGGFFLITCLLAKCLISDDRERLSFVF